MLGRVKLAHTYQSITSSENLLEAWKEFLTGKKYRKDVQEFEQNLMGNILSLHRNLAAKTYTHSPYVAFNISDPKPRNIHKASVRDRLVHHALYRKLYPFFDRTFIAHSYSCRRGKGTHKALDKFSEIVHKATGNHKKTAWVLKCDVRKFFASIDHDRLLKILGQYVPDEDVLWLLSEIIGSFETAPGIGLPLGNLTSQLFVNVYMNEFDQFVKHRIKAKYYIRYADDFVIVSQDKDWLLGILPKIEKFLHERLRLTLHPEKVSVRTVASGVDFLGWVHFPDHRVLRTTAKRRMLRGIKERGENEQTVQSYLGLMSHGNTKKLRQIVEGEVKNMRENRGGGVNTPSRRKGN